MSENITSELLVYKTMNNEKPNFTALGKKYGFDRHTVAKMYAEKDCVIKHKKKSSQFDKYREVIIERLSQGYIRLSSILWYLNNTFHENFEYDALKKYVQSNKLREKVLKIIAHPLYETDPGDMIQCDWIEDIKIHLKNGEEITFNVFSATLGYSRFHYFEYTEHKTEVDAKRCITHCFKKLGGLTRRILTDNMTALVSFRNNVPFKHQSVIQFEKDLGVDIKFCKRHTPQTKGKVETSNKYANWLLSYDYKLESFEQLLDLIKQLNIDCNREKNTTTNIPPVILFDKKEKQTLRPLPRKSLLDYYERDLTSIKVQSTSLITYEGARYSVPPNYINKVVQLIEVSKMIYIYFNDEIIAQHPLNSKGSINYTHEHYKSCLIGKFGNQDQIDLTVKENLKRFKNLGENYE